MPDIILGLSAYYHDSAAALLIDGEIVAAAQEERFTRVKHDPAFPTHAVRAVLARAGVDPGELTAVAFYDKPFLKFERLLETYHAFAPKGLRSFVAAMPVWVKEKLFMRTMINEELEKAGIGRVELLFPEHHLSHAASAFYPSPFDSAAILTVDGVGEWATTTIGRGDGKDITVLREIDFPHSLGLFYSAFTHYCGFKVNSGEYKLMGLAPYGNPDSAVVRKWADAIQSEMIDVREDGSFYLNMKYFNYATGLTMCNDAAWERLFGVLRRKSETEIAQPYMDLALAVQQTTERVISGLAGTAKKLTGLDSLVMAGGVALNCVANGRLLRSGMFKNIWIQPAAGDAGGALGAAYAAWHIGKGRERRLPKTGEADAMQGAYLGPEFGAADIAAVARRYGAPSREYADFAVLCNDVAELLDQGNVIGWFQGRMEFGPRALGNRSIIADPRKTDMQRKLNLKIKYREGFRPFAPSVLEEDAGEYFDLDRPSPYMLLVAPVRSDRCNPLPPDYASQKMFEKLYFLRSDLPAITHVDYTARIQSVSRLTNPRYWQLINAFKKKTGCSVIVNTSFNVRGEPIVCTPEDAYRCFMRTEMDCLVMGDRLFDKKKQPPLRDDIDWKSTFAMD